MYTVIIADIAELTEEVLGVEFGSERITTDSRPSKIVARITVFGQISYDSGKQFIRDSTKAIADWSLLDPGNSDAYKKTTVKFSNTGDIRYELPSAFAISYSERLEDENGFFKLEVKEVNPESCSAAPVIKTGNAALLTNIVGNGARLSLPAVVIPDVATLDRLVTEVIAGKWLNQPERERLLTAAGFDYGAVQAEVNRRLQNEQISAVIKEVTYTITYDANEGAGEPSSQIKVPGVSLTLSNEKPIRSGFSFLGWSTTSTAKKAEYQAGSSYTLNSDSTLYAVWFKIIYISYMKIYQSPRLPGKAEGSTSESAPDMLINDRTLTQLREMKRALYDKARQYDSNSIISGSESVKREARSLANIFSLNDSGMRKVAQSMFDRFFSGSGMDYRDGTLTQKAVAHTSTQNYINIAKQKIIDYLKSNNGDPSNINNSIKSTLDNPGIRPKYNLPSDLLSGLTICINDTWGNYIELMNYRYDGITYRGTLRFTIYDHFGLDDEDVATSFESFKKAIVGNMDGFLSWYVLQHYTGCNGQYKPFITYIETEVSISGDI